MKKIIMAAVVAVLLLVAAAAAYRHFALVAPLKEQLVRDLHDPGTVQYRDLQLVSNWRLRGSYLCGQLNAKNRMGAYTGFRWFNSDGVGFSSIETDQVAEIFDKRNLKRCMDTDGLPWWYITK